DTLRQECDRFVDAGYGFRAPATARGSRIATAGERRRPLLLVPVARCGRSGCRDPGLPLRLVGVDPDLAGLVVRLAAVDGGRHRVLVLVGPAEVLDERPRCGARVGELLACDLVEDVVGIVAGNLLRIGVAA